MPKLKAQGKSGHDCKYSGKTDFISVNCLHFKWTSNRAPQLACETNKLCVSLTIQQIYLSKLN